MARSYPPSLSLVIPTRNEADNVDRLISSICAAMPGPTKELVFVDDSDDPTPAVLQRRLRATDCPGLVLQRANASRAGGLATAVVRGMQVSSGHFICTMDADLQHPASAVPLLLAAAEEAAADVVVGSRYMKGGGADGFDGFGRRTVSQVARLAARALLASARWTTDPLSGFFLVRRDVVDGVELRPIGYKILLEILVRGRWQRIADVPYAFHSRNAGVSNATFREGMQFARHVSHLLGVGSLLPPTQRLEYRAQGLSTDAALPTVPSWLVKNGKAAASGNGHRAAADHEHREPVGVLPAEGRNHAKR